MFRCVFVSICLIQYILASHKSERLLLNDPSLIMERLTELEITVQRLSAANQIQAAEIRQLQNLVNNTKDTPAFFVILSTSAAIGNGEILKFDLVKTNSGGGYDFVTGVFVAPRSGTYQFTSVVYTHEANDAVVQLNKNKDVMLRGYSVGTSLGTSHTMNAVVELQKGDHIYVQHRGSSSDAVLGELHSSFSGFMISE